MRSDTEEGGPKGCKARRSLPKVLQMVWASSSYGIVRGRLGARGWLSSPLLRCVYIYVKLYYIIYTQFVLGVCGNCGCMDHGWHTIYADIDDMETERLYRIRLGTVEGRLENRNLASL